MLQPDKKTAIVNGYRMAYREIGEGDPIVFAHGNPTSSYLWRNVMPHLEGLGRLIACDMIGMGDSDKLDPSGPDRYSYLEHREYLFALWEQLGIEQNAILVLHDWGSALGFDWAAQHPDRVRGHRLRGSHRRPDESGRLAGRAQGDLPGIVNLASRGGWEDRGEWLPAASYAGFRYPGEIISHAVWLYFRFALSLRDVSELMLAVA